MIRSNFCDYNDIYILVSGTITIDGAGADDNANRLDERNKEVVSKYCVPFTKYTSNINNTQKDNAKDTDVVMEMYNLIEYSDNYLKTSESLWQYYRYDSNDNIAQPESFKSKIEITGKSPTDSNTKNVEIVVPLKHLSNFCRTLEKPLNYEITFDLTCSYDFVISSANGKTKFAITDTKLYVPVVTLSTEDNIKLLKQLESGFKRTINSNKYQSKLEDKEQKKYFDYLIDRSFQGINRLFVLLFENRTDREVHTKHYSPKVEIKVYNVTVDGRNSFDQPITNDLRTYDNIRKTATGQGDDYTTGCLLDYHYFKEQYKLIATDLSKQQKVDADPKAIQ